MPGSISSPSQNTPSLSSMNSEQQRIERKRLAERSLTFVEKIQQFIDYVKGLIYEEPYAVGDAVVCPPDEDQKKRAKEMGVHDELNNANNAENSLNFSDDNYALKTMEVLDVYLNLWRGDNTELSYKDKECFCRIKQAYGEPIALFIRGKIASLTIKISKKIQDLTFSTSGVHTVDDYLIACAELSFWKIKPQSHYYFYKKIPGDECKKLVLDEKAKLELDLAQVRNKFPSEALCINYLQEQEAFHFITGQYEPDCASIQVDSPPDQHPITPPRRLDRHWAASIDLVSVGRAIDRQKVEDDVKPVRQNVSASEWPSLNSLQKHSEQRPAADVKLSRTAATLAYEVVDEDFAEPPTLQADLPENVSHRETKIKSLWLPTAGQLLPDTKAKTAMRSDKVNDVDDIELFSKPFHKEVVVSEKLEKGAEEISANNRLALEAAVEKDQQESSSGSPTKRAKVEQASAANSEPTAPSSKEHLAKDPEEPFFEAAGLRGSPRSPLLRPNLDSSGPSTAGLEQRDDLRVQGIYIPTSSQAIPKEPTRLETITNKLLLKIEGQSKVDEESMKRALDTDERSILEQEFADDEKNLAFYYKGIAHAAKAQKAINDVKNSSAPPWLSVWWNSRRIDEALTTSKYASINGVPIQKAQLDLVNQVIEEKREINYRSAYKLLRHLDAQSKEIKNSEVQNGLAFFKQYAKVCYGRARGPLLEIDLMDIAVEFDHPEACMDRARSYMQQAEEDAQHFIRAPQYRRRHSAHQLSDMGPHPGFAYDYGVNLGSDPALSTREAKRYYLRVVNNCGEDAETRPLAAEAAFKLAFLIEHGSSNEVTVQPNRFFIKKAIEFGSEEAKRFEQFANSTSSTKEELNRLLLEVAEIYTDRAQSGKGTKEDSQLAISFLKLTRQHIYAPEAELCLYYLRSVQAKNENLPIDLSRRDVMALGNRAKTALDRLGKAAEEAFANEDYLKKKDVEKKYQALYRLADENMTLNSW